MPFGTVIGIQAKQATVPQNRFVDTSGYLSWA